MDTMAVAIRRLYIPIVQCVRKVSKEARYRSRPWDAKRATDRPCTTSRKQIRRRIPLYQTRAKLATQRPAGPHRLAILHPLTATFAIRAPITHLPVRWAWSRTAFRERSAWTPLITTHSLTRRNYRRPNSRANWKRCSADGWTRKTISMDGSAFRQMVHTRGDYRLARQAVLRMGGTAARQTRAGCVVEGVKGGRTERLSVRTPWSLTAVIPPVVVLPPNLGYPEINSANAIALTECRRLWKLWVGKKQRAGPRSERMNDDASRGHGGNRPIWRPGTVAMTGAWSYVAVGEGDLDLADYRVCDLICGGRADCQARTHMLCVCENLEVE